MKEYRIHPAIGVARVGNAQRGDTEGEGWFIGPETPGVPSNYDTFNRTFNTFKDNGYVKAQVARFRVWEYVEQEGQLVPTKEVNLDTSEIVSIEWTVELANCKAAFFKFNGQTGAEDLFASLPKNLLRNNSVAIEDRAKLLTINPGQRHINGRNSAAHHFNNTKSEIPISTLGEIRTDQSGRLLVFGGYGHSAFSNTIPGGKEGMETYANNDGWFDDVSDGPITAKIVVRQDDGSEKTFEATHGAWVFVGPPDYAPSIDNVVTLYDTFCDQIVRNPDLPIPPNHALYTDYAPGKGLGALRTMRENWQSKNGLGTYSPSFTREVFPIIYRGFQTRWVHQALNVNSENGEPHKSISPDFWTDLASTRNTNLKGMIMREMRDPDQKSPLEFPTLMPRAWGDTYQDTFPLPSHSPYLSLTRTQLAILYAWAKNTFVFDWKSAPEIPKEEDITPEGLDRAALESCVGGAFYPGIEVSWLIRSAAVFVEPFRIAHDKLISTNVNFGPLKIGPGFFSQQMALPWQADFADCTRETSDTPEQITFAWWPGQRPDDVFLNDGNNSMVEWARNIIGEDVPGQNNYQKWHRAMVMKWSTRGFVINVNEKFIESEGP